MTLKVKKDRALAPSAKDAGATPELEGDLAALVPHLSKEAGKSAQWDEFQGVAPVRTSLLGKETERTRAEVLSLVEALHRSCPELLGHAIDTRSEPPRLRVFEQYWDGTYHPVPTAPTLEGTDAPAVAAALSAWLSANAGFEGGAASAAALAALTGRRVGAHLRPVNLERPADELVDAIITELKGGRVLLANARADALFGPSGLKPKRSYVLFEEPRLDSGEVTVKLFDPVDKREVRLAADQLSTALEQLVVVAPRDLLEESAH